MEATLGRDPVYKPVGFGGAFTRQFRLLWNTRRPLLLLVGLLAVLALAGEPWNAGPLTRLLAAAPVWLTVVGPVWAIAVYHNEGPSNRLYHWSQPVRRDIHTLARLGAGAAWLLILYAVLALAGVLMAAVDGAGGQLSAVGFVAWVNFFTAPLIGFVGLSILTVLSDYPIRWFFGLFFLFVASLALVEEWLGWSAVVEYVLAPLGGEAWALGPTLVVPFMAARGSIEAALGGLPDNGGIMGDGFLSTWWVATPLWLLFFGAIVWFLARRHPDVLPGWRRSA